MVRLSSMLASALFGACLLAASAGSAGAADQRVVPWAAVMHDIHGGTWVYENTAPLTYVRRRVQVRYVVDDLAVLESGPPVGARRRHARLLHQWRAPYT